jgi:hypothetical protein
MTLVLDWLLVSRGVVGAGNSWMLIWYAVNVIVPSQLFMKYEAQCNQHQARECQYISVGIISRFKAW